MKVNIFSGHPTLWAFIVFMFLAVYALGANPIKGETVAPMDVLLEFPGWSAIQPDRKAVFLERGDILDSMLPLWTTLKEQIRAGKGALWYPNGAGGQPVSLDLFDPTFLLFLAVKNNVLAFYIVSLTKLVVAGFGGYLLIKIFARWFPSVWGGSVFMLCGFNTAWFFWPQVSTAMWIPWLLWSTFMFLRTEDNRWLPAVTIVSVLMILGGFPAVAAFGFYSIAFLVSTWVLRDLFRADRLIKVNNSHSLRHAAKKATLPVLAVGIAFLMSAISLVPFIDNMRGINLGYRTGGGTFFEFRDLLLLFYNEASPMVEKTAYIGAPAIIFAFMGIITAFRADDEKPRRFISCISVLLLVTISITFGLLPSGLIRMIPVFNFNNWGRLIVVPLLCIAALSAIGLGWVATVMPSLIKRYLKISSLTAGWLVIVALAAIAAFQFQSQKKLFNNYNAVVPSSLFYPVTPSIKYVQEHLAPLQSVIADNSFMTAGTLGAYGIPEWYAHSFRTDTEKEVLSSLVHNAVASPTSMYINGNDIQYNSPLMDRLAIKYLMINKDVLNPRNILSLPEISPGMLPPLPDNSWKQHMDLLDDITISAMGFSFSTFGEENAPANVRLTVYDDGGLLKLASVEIDRNKISDNKWVYFRFPDNLFLKKGAYLMTLSLAEYRGPRKLTALATANQENTGIYLEINGLRSESSLQWKMVVQEHRDLSFLAGKWKIIELEKNVVVLENEQVTNGAYFIKGLDDPNEQPDFTGLDIRQLSADLIKINYSGRDAGWIVLPMHLDKGWKAYVDNRRVSYNTYLRILPAIPVEKACDVMFKYGPDSFRTGAIISLTGISIFMIFIIICTRSGAGKILNKLN